MRLTCWLRMIFCSFNWLKSSLSFSNSAFFFRRHFMADLRFWMRRLLRSLAWRNSLLLIFVEVAWVVLFVRREVGLFLVRGILLLFFGLAFAATSHVGIVRIFLIRRRNVTLFGSPTTTFCGLCFGDLNPLLCRRGLFIVSAGSAVGGHRFCRGLPSTLS